MRLSAKFAAASTALALVLTAPGFLPYQALAAVVIGHAGAKTAPVSSGFAGSPLTRVSNPAGPAAIGLSPVSFSGSLPGLPPAPGLISPVNTPAGNTLPEETVSPSVITSPMSRGIELAAPSQIMPFPAEQKASLSFEPQAVPAGARPLTDLENLASPSSREEASSGGALESAATRFGEIFDGKSKVPAPLDLGAGLTPAQTSRELDASLVPAAASAKSIVPSWFIDTSKLSFSFVRMGKDGFLSAALRHGRYELGVFVDTNGDSLAIFTKYSLNPMGTPKKEEIPLTTDASRRAVADILSKTQASEPVSGDEKAALDAILAALQPPLFGALNAPSENSPVTGRETAAALGQHDDGKALRQRLGRALSELGKFEQNPFEGKMFYIASDDDSSVRDAKGRTIGWSKAKRLIDVFNLKPNWIKPLHIFNWGALFGATVAIRLKPVFSTGKPFRVSLREITPYDIEMRGEPYANWQKTLEMDYRELARFVETMVRAVSLKEIPEFRGYKTAPDAAVRAMSAAR